MTPVDSVNPFAEQDWPLSARRSHKPIIVRRGDWWVFTTNYGCITRKVRSVSCGVVSYIGHAGFQQCLLSTFRRWARGASLESAEDWNGR